MLLKKELDFAQKTAVAAGQIALRYAGRACKTQYKDGDRHNPLTEADKIIDQFLQQAFAEAFPDDGWLSEETADDGSRYQKPRCWVVDPIDGTSAFLRWLSTDMPTDHDDQDRRQFSISIALIIDGAPALGLVYAPLRHQLFYAIAGAGLYCNGQPVARASPPQQLLDCIYLSSVRETEAGLLAELDSHIKLRPLGSVAYKLALTAVTPQAVTASVKRKSRWDVAAGDLLCREAGLKVTDLRGDMFDYTREKTSYNGLVAAPPHLHEQLLAVLPPLAAGY